MSASLIGEVWIMVPAVEVLPAGDHAFNVVS